MNTLAVSEPIRFTDSAVNKVKSLIESDVKKNLKLRVYIVGGGCSGFQYGFAFDENINEDDIIIEKDSVKMVVDALSVQYLMNAEVDYIESLQGSHFIVRNPNAETTCGCGSSFSIKEELLEDNPQEEIK